MLLNLYNLGNIDDIFERIKMVSDSETMFCFFTSMIVVAYFEGKSLKETLESPSACEAESSSDEPPRR